MVILCGTLISTWETTIEPLINTNRDAHELDITVPEARTLGIVAGNETYIGRRVIATNIDRELPKFIQYLSGSFRHICAKPCYGSVPTNVLSAVETAFTQAFREGNWLEPHIQVISSDELHGRGVFMVIPKPESRIDTVPVYVPPEDFIFPIESRDIQNAPMLGIRYSISAVQYQEWAKRYGWAQDVADAVLKIEGTGEQVNKMFQVYLMLIKAAELDPVTGQAGPKVVKCFWFSKEQNKAMTPLVNLAAGFYNQDGTARPTRDYPVFPVYYKITENPVLVERKGRAHADMHDQEALTMMWTGYVNGTIRASEVYVAMRESGMTENPEITQTEFIIDPGKILHKPVDFFSMPWPDASMIPAVQALQSVNSSSAGQVDFAAQARKDSRKTAKELSLAEDQSDQASTIPLTMFAIGYAMMLEFMWQVVTENILSGYNTEFMKEQPEIRAGIAYIDQQGVVQKPILIRPAGDIDYIERTEKLKKYTNYYPTFAGTSVGPFFQEKMLELAFPDEFVQMKPLLVDNSKQMGAALLQVISQLPMEAMVEAQIITPETAQQIQTIIADAQKSLAPAQPADPSAQSPQTPQTTPDAPTATSAGPGY